MSEFCNDLSVSQNTKLKFYVSITFSKLKCLFTELFLLFCGPHPGRIPVGTTSFTSILYLCVVQLSCTMVIGSGIAAPNQRLVPHQDKGTTFVLLFSLTGCSTAAELLPNESCYIILHYLNNIYATSLLLTLQSVGHGVSLDNVCLVSLHFSPWVGSSIYKMQVYNFNKQ